MSEAKDPLAKGPQAELPREDSPQSRRVNTLLPTRLYEGLLELARVRNTTLSAVLEEAAEILTGVDALVEENGGQRTIHFWRHPWTQKLGYAPVDNLSIDPSANKQ